MVPPGTTVASELRFGLKLPNCGGILCPPEFADPATIDRIASAAVDAGFDSVWLHDHMAVPAELAHLERPDFLEPLVVASHLATAFPSLTVGFAAIVLPFRDPVLLAKQITTLATFNPGRVIAGVGIGRYESEFEALGLDSYHRRGAVSDEWLTIIRALLDGERAVTIDGPTRQLREAVVYPKRRGPSDPAIWVAGNSRPGALRAARFGDGWLTAAVPVDEVLEMRAVIDKARGGVTTPFTLALSATVKRSRGSEAEVDGHRLHTHTSAIQGDTDAVAEQLSGYTVAGVTHFVLSLGTGPLDALLEDVAWFGVEVRPRVAERTVRPVQR
jgi:alkanesulfonate monooxygenase SsuD/methylene tetrahydromethanopterin reductase-like flavin-dependent oxidoreductase (luciferase family)